MPRKIITKIIIQASTAQVWRTLTNFKVYPQWNPFLIQIQGSCALSASIHIQTRLLNNQLLVCTTQLTEMIENQQMSWQGKLFCKGILDSEHHYYLQALNEDACCLTQEKQLSGILVPIIWFQVYPQLSVGLNKMNQALKRFIEERYATNQSSSSGQSLPTTND